MAQSPHEMCDDLKDFMSKVQFWEKDVLAKFTDIEVTVNEVDSKLVELEHLVKEYRESKKAKLPLKPQQQQKADQPPIISEKWPELAKEIIFKSHLMRSLQLSYHNIGSPQLKLCLLSFAIFPGNSVIKKRSLIYWWIGEGLVSKSKDKTAEQVGEEVYDKLIKQGLIEPDDSGPSPLMNRCKVYQCIRYMLILLAQEAGLFYFISKADKFPEVLRKCSFSSSRLRLILGGEVGLLDEELAKDGAAKDEDVSTVFNVNQQYLSLSHPWLLNMKSLAVLQLGRWVHLPEYHIEVEDQKFLNDLGVHHKHLKFLSLRGISRITTLPDSIINLVSLEILDLRACHNLEKLPKDIASLKKLTHLDVSECYLIESMPKGTEKLSSLQVLKGFVVGTTRKNPCRISDLKKLTQLRRLSISIGRGAAIRGEEFASLKALSYLCTLSVSWGVTSTATQSNLPKNSFFPEHLEKLELIGIPVKGIPTWLNPRELKNLKKLYISGGKLEKWDHQQHSEQWSVEILRLKHLKELSIEDKKDVQEMFRPMFPQLKHFECINCADKDILWRESSKVEKGL